ncbi:Transcription elongation factor [Trichinella pseudospiralis]
MAAVLRLPAGAIAGLWLHGPPWLMQNAMAGTGETAADQQHLVARQRAISALTGQTDKCSLEQVINPTRYNRYEPLIRVTAYCLRIFP